MAVHAQELPHAKLQLIADAGHYPNLEAPEVFIRHVEAFLQTA